ncbi:acyl dehydratase [Lipingzhangella halophila]|uniref:Acyl dehydratase n=1 Tax=Lipingzhangella halophila TaxID=1783352 RepID=A0A7W7RHE4_9ACTN|nr:MaoC family dehydratase N-terminal domain-containing protein [Lipingzhangella halophila]MBB4931481.1 acyl dehydratase [Lipingzhangella halophila]
MALDPSVIGTEVPEARMLVERGRLRLFCKAIGETDPVYLDVDAARAAGHPDLPVPPTFLCSIQNERPDPLDWLPAIGVDPLRVLHGEQSCVYHAVAHARDELTVRGRLTDLTVKKNGHLELLTRESVVTDGEGNTVAELRDTVVVRHPEVVR